jgi:hypothetical protein
VVPKHEAPYREFNVAAAVRDVSCVTCRACDVARDRSIGRESEEESRHSVGKEILPKFLLLLLLRHPALLNKIILTGFGPLQITTKIILDFRQRAEIVPIWPKSAPFSYTCPNYQLF